MHPGGAVLRQTPLSTRNPVRIGLQTWGSEGDVQPFLALGEELARAKHEVTLVVCDPTQRDYGVAARRAGISLRVVAEPA
jgi:sterol 3beta-glucosyltransferase